MTRKDLMDVLIEAFPRLSVQQVDHAVREIFETWMKALERNERIELRGFGRFELRARKAVEARNPRTGEKVHAPSRHVIHFKAGKALKERINHPDNLPEKEQ